MKREFGNMFDTIDDKTEFRNQMLLVTTNAYRRADGALVMGRGAAKQLALRYPDVPYAFGRRLTRGQLLQYGIMTLPPEDLTRPWLGAFQVKRHFKDAADVELIKDSVLVLNEMAKKMPHMRIDMNYPGIGNGRLAIDIVDPLLTQLPDNVHIWQFHPEAHKPVMLRRQAS